MINLVYIGLILVTVYLSQYVSRYLFALIFIPAVVVCYFLFIPVMANQIGYSIDHQYVDKTKKVIYLHGVIEEKFVYLLIKEPEKEPRLVKFPATEENKRKANDMNSQKAEGKFIMLDMVGKPPDGLPSSESETNKYDTIGEQYNPIQNELKKVEQ